MSITQIEEMLPTCGQLKNEALEIANPAIRTLVDRYRKVFELIGPEENLSADRYRKIYETVTLQDDYAHDTFLSILKASDQFLLDNSNLLTDPDFLAVVRNSVKA